MATIEKCYELVVALVKSDAELRRLASRNGSGIDLEWCKFDIVIDHGGERYWGSLSHNGEKTLVLEGEELVVKDAKSFNEVIDQMFAKLIVIKSRRVDSLRRDADVLAASLPR